MNYPFKANARIILEMGKESIENKTIALSELVKNSYDANASVCKIKLIDNGPMINLLEKEISSIEIVDDGDGMTKEDIINNWLTLGTSSKKDLKTNEDTQFVSNRRPIGEKGIGRLAMNQIGNKVKIITKKENDECNQIEIDFNLFNANTFLEDIKFEIKKVIDEEIEKQGKGTKIIIEDLNESWTSDEISKVYDEVLKLQSPFKDKSDSFDISFITPYNSLFKTKLKPDEIFKYSLWNATLTIKPNTDKGIIDFNFTPYEEMQGFVETNKQAEIIYNENGSRSISKINIGDYKIGEIKIRLYAFHRSSAILKMLGTKKKQFKEYLDEHGGVRVYRNGQRVYNYGSKNEDWLDLNIKRLNSPGTKLSKNILIGFVELDGSQSLDLIEKTNREGFIENDAFLEFKKVVSATVDEFAYLMINSKNRIKEVFDKNIKNEKIDDSFDELISEIQEASFTNEDDKDKLIAITEKIAKDFQDTRKLYLSIANNSVDFYMVFHDVDKQINFLLNQLNNDNESLDYDGIKKTVFVINDILSLQKDLITNRDFKNINISDIIKKFNAYYKQRALDHEIEVTLLNEEFSLFCVESQIIRILMNLFDNSVYWLGTRESGRKIFISFTKSENNITLYFADNGPGFKTEDPTTFLKPFATKKASGLGLGLYITNEIVDMHNGKLDFIETGATEIPKEFEEGAKLKIELGV